MPFTAKVITTSEWGAKPPLASFELTTPKYVIVHHTAGQNPPKDSSRGTRDGAMTLARRIQTDHMSRGWSDSGHNFLNTTGGFVAEGRTGTVEAIKKGKCIRSAHAAQDPGRLAKGNESPGIENEGNFMAFAMNDVQWASLVDLCAALCTACDISPANIRGHREFSNTQCPGDWLFGQLPRLRQEVAEKLGVALTPTEAFNLPPRNDRVRMGDVGPIVIATQKLLLGQGQSPGAIDGIFGENTKSAVIAFQRDHGIKASGEIDAATRQALGL
ncbi:MAG TPA: N-acetylmuramoyl-L-alanine amidase [Vineibacter sp.]|nr:N-acetylmuramoyl-L-alanine amidase [Vineibacter sp.]